eukprot:10085981-Alexandrium_andersonii.AAC.1
MSCRRAPEMAAGAFFAFVDQLIGLAVNDVLVATIRLGEADRAKVMGDFEQGRSAVVSFLRRKFDHYLRLPYSLLTIGLANEARAREHLQQS